MNGKKIDLVVDIETTATGRLAGILTIAVVTVNPDFVQEFYEKIDPTLLQKNGYVIDPRTMEWWDKQNKAVRAEAFSGIRMLPDVLHDLNAWLISLDYPFNIWSKPASFDLSILKDAYDKCGIEPSWAFRDERCQMTINKLFSGIRRPPFIGTAHNALTDARNQAAHLREIFNHLQAAGVIGYES